MARLPKTMYHGTSRRHLERLLADPMAHDLYLTDVEEKAWNYAEQAAKEDGSELAMLSVKPSKLPGEMEVDVGVVEAEWEQEMGQWIYDGPLPRAAVENAYYIDEDDDSRQSLLNPVEHLKASLMPPG